MLSHRLFRACGWAATAAVLVFSPAAMPFGSSVVGASALPSTLHIEQAPAIAPVPTGLVTRSGNRLMLGSQQFRFTGANLYWLGLDDNIRDAAGSPTYPTQYRIRNALQAAADAGMTVIRSHTLGISVGCAKCFEPSRGVFRSAALASADYAIAQAGRLGMKIVVPLTDQWRWYHGGESTFTGWRGYQNQPTQFNAANSPAQRAAEAHFYTDPVVVADYKAYISRLLGHVNPYTGLKYKDDPTILAWETGNEIWTANPGWTQEIARFIKHDIGARQLIADGTAATGMRTANAAVNGADVDILGGHFYPIDTAWAATDAATAKRWNKAYLIGEYAWTDVAATDRLLSMVESTPSISGALLWTLLPYQENRLPEPHGDGYAFYSPATTPTMQTVLNRIKLNAVRLRSG